MSEIETGMHYPIDLQALPSAWAKGYIGDFFQKVQSGFACGQHNSDAKGVIHVRPMNISRDGTLDFQDMRFVPPDYDQRRLQPGDVLFNNTNSPALIGKTTYIDERAAGLAFSNHMTRLNQAGAVDPKFAALQLHFLWMTGYFLHRCVKHVNQASVSSKELEKTVPLVAPPFGEQQRIVTKIEKLFSTLDKSVEYLRTAQDQLKVCRQSLLKHAFEGKLTEKWREDNASELAWVPDERIRKAKSARNIEQLSSEDLKLLPELPLSWRWERLGRVADIIGGVTKGRKLDGKETVFAPYLRVANVQDGYLDLAEIKTIEVLPSDLEKYRLISGDVLYTEGGDRDKLGRGTVWKDELPGCIHQNHIFRARLQHDLVNPRYVAIFSQTAFAKDYFQSKAKQTVNLASINLTVLSKLPIPLPPKKEQDAIVEELDALLSDVLALEDTLNSSVLEGLALRQSILKQAFSGKLVPQDPNDEPATVLLERIKAAQTNGSNHTNGNGSRTKTAKKTPKAIKQKVKKA